MIYVDGVSELAALWYVTISLSTWFAVRQVVRGWLER